VLAEISRWPNWRRQLPPADSAPQLRSLPRPGSREAAGAVVWGRQRPAVLPGDEAIPGQLVPGPAGCFPARAHLTSGRAADRVAAAEHGVAGHRRGRDGGRVAMADLGQAGGGGRAGGGRGSRQGAHQRQRSRSGSPVAGAELYAHHAAALVNGRRVVASHGANWLGDGQVGRCPVLHLVLGQVATQLYASPIPSASLTRQYLMTTKSTAPLPTLADLDALPPGVVGEIIEGVLYETQHPGNEHQFVLSRISADISVPFGRGGTGPGGWWILHRMPFEFADGTLELVPDVAGWRCRCCRATRRAGSFRTGSARSCRRRRATTT